jgi:CBS domain-containing protein
VKTLAQLLGTPPRKPLAVSPGDSVIAALQLMAEHNIGAVMVMDGERLAGVLSERDYARKIVLQGKTSKDTLVKDIMTEKVITATPEQTVSDAMSLMSTKRIRHLPVVDGSTLVGVISIGDVVKETISEQAFLIEQLESYIRA